MVPEIWPWTVVVDKNGLSTGTRLNGTVSPTFGCFAQEVVHRGCLILAVSSWTRLSTLRSSWMSYEIHDVACMTWLWSRPPNFFPILGRELSVSSRQRYIATCRG